MLQKSHEAATSFLDAFRNSRKGKGKGASTDAEQDLLRAMLVFAAAGLDAMLKELVRTALPVLLNKGIGQKSFVGFVARRTEGPGPVDHKFLAAALASANARNHLIKAWLDDQTSGSLQSVDEVLKLTTNFEIDFAVIFPQKAQRESLRKAFEARNQIVHEMDLKFSSTRSRHQRTVDDATNLTQQVFETAAILLSAVEAKLAAPAP